MPNEADPAEQVRELLRSYGRTYAQVAVAAARELFTAGYRTPAAMAEASWQHRVDAIGRAPYVDARMTEGARRAGLPAGRGDLAALVRLSLTRNPSLDKTTEES